MFFLAFLNDLCITLNVKLDFLFFMRKKTELSFNGQLAMTLKACRSARPTCFPSLRNVEPKKAFDCLHVYLHLSLIPQNMKFQSL